MKLSLWWYTWILGCTGKFWVSGQYLKIPRTALSIRVIGCIGTLTTQGYIGISKKSRADISIWSTGCIGTFIAKGNIRRYLKLSRGFFRLNHRSYRYVDDTGKYEKIWKNLAQFFPYESSVVLVIRISLKNMGYLYYYMHLTVTSVYYRFLYIGLYWLDSAKWIIFENPLHFYFHRNHRLYRSVNNRCPKM